MTYKKCKVQPFRERNGVGPGVKFQRGEGVEGPRRTLLNRKGAGLDRDLEECKGVEPDTRVQRATNVWPDR